MSRIVTLTDLNQRNTVQNRRSAAASFDLISHYLDVPEQQGLWRLQESLKNAGSNSTREGILWRYLQKRNVPEVQRTLGPTRYNDLRRLWTLAVANDIIIGFSTPRQRALATQKLVNLGKHLGLNFQVLKERYPKPIPKPLLRNVVSLIGEDHKAPSPEEECLTCAENRINTTLVNCGHRILCVACANILLRTDRKCPVCQQIYGSIIVN